ncbi:MAG: DNA-binding protein [Nitrospirae bacterium]|nr:MAG: DNA-binding protein [Nitrospirota bacterium]
MRKIIVSAIIVLLALAGCSAEKYGLDISKNAPVVKVKDVYLDMRLLGRDVTLEGKISSQCGSNGCWFVLQDDTGQIFINLAPSNLTLPPRLGKQSTVTGQVQVVQNELQIFAKGIEVR